LLSLDLERNINENIDKDKDIDINIRRKVKCLLYSEGESEGLSWVVGRLISSYKEGWWWGGVKRIIR